MKVLAVCGLGGRRIDLLLLSSLLCLSTLAPRHVSCQLDNFRESAGKLFSSMKDTVKENLGPAVKKVTETASDALDMAKKKVSEALGPDLSNGGRRRPRKGESCPAEGCPYDDEDSGHGGYSPPKSTESEDSEEGPNREVAKVPDSEPGLFKTIFGSASTGLATVGRTLYDTLSDMSARFADTVRKIMNEELYDLLATSVKKVGEALFSPGEIDFPAQERRETFTVSGMSIRSSPYMYYAYIGFFTACI